MSNICDHTYQSILIVDQFLEMAMHNRVWLCHLAKQTSQLTVLCALQLDGRVDIWFTVVLQNPEEWSASPRKSLNCHNMASV